MQHGDPHAEGPSAPPAGGAQAASYNRKAAMRQELDVMLNGRYHVNRQLNSGATATVFSGVDLRNNKKVAIKVLNSLGHDGASKEQQQYVVAMAERELQLVETLQFRHKHVVSLLQVLFDSPEKQRVVMIYDLVDGVELFDLINSLPGCCLPEGRARRYFRHLRSAVDYIHQRGLAHRDIKPENCMIETATDHLKLIDFGNSSTLASCRTLMIGTPDYMAPEMIAESTTWHSAEGPRPMADEKYDAKAVDVWSMGALLYIITVGAFPFEDPARPGNMAATLVNVQRGHYNRLPSTASLELGDLLACMFKVTPSKRIKLDQMRQHPWLCIPEEKAVSDEAVAHPARTPAPPARSPKAVPAAAATVQAMEAAQAGSPRKSKEGEGAHSPRSALGMLTFGLRGMAVSPPTSPSSARSSASSAGDALPGAARKRPAWLHLP